MMMMTMIMMTMLVLSIHEGDMVILATTIATMTTMIAIAITTTMWTSTTITMRMLSKVWAHVYGRDNLNVAPEDHAVLLTEAPLNPYKNRRQCAETFFENFGVPAMFCAPQVR